MLQSGDSVLVGVSGGPDSVALLHVLHRLAQPFSLTLGVAHLNHCLRKKDSDRDAEFVGSLAGRFNLPFFLEKKDVRKYQLRHKLSLEEAARKLRYNFFHHTAKENRFNKIALGHHRDDNAELILMYLIRGSGRLGLTGIPSVRNNIIIRPLIHVSRNEIIDFLTTEGFEFVTDLSNQDRRFFRNKIRHQLIPLLENSYNPEIKRTITRLAAILRTEDEWIETLLESSYKESLSVIQENKVVLSIPRVKDIHLAAIRRIIRKAIAHVKSDLKRITFKHVDAVTTLIRTGPSYGNLDLPNGIKVKREGDQLIFSTEKNDHQTESSDNRTSSFDYEYIIQKPDILLIKEIGRYIKFSVIDIKEQPDFIRSGQSVAFFDIEKLSFPMILRNFKPGDRFSPLGMSGSQKVKNYFINNKISRSERSICPLLISDGRIIWIVGHRIDDSVKVVPSTKKLLKAELLLA